MEKPKEIQKRVGFMFSIGSESVLVVCNYIFIPYLPAASGLKMESKEEMTKFVVLHSCHNCFYHQ